MGITLRGICCYYFTTLVVVLGVCCAGEFLIKRNGVPDHRDLVRSFANWDGQAYRRIAEHGYGEYEDGRVQSLVAFFPAHPLLARCASWGLGIGTQAALLLVAHACLLSAFVVWAAYLKRTIVGGADGAIEYSLLALALAPTTFFFRMAYSESLFLLATTLVLYGVARKWPLVAVALLAGLATATRPVGAALLPVLGLHAWRTLGRHRRGARLAGVAAVLLLGVWGLAAFAFYQWRVCGDPLAFARWQLTWNLRIGADYSLRQAIVATATLEPIWSVFAPSKVEYWARYEPHNNPLFSLQFANPIYFVGTIVLVIIGWRKKWLNEYELLLSAGLLLIPYVTKSYDNAMASFGRFSAVVLPAYIVMGHLLHRMGPALAALVLALMAVMLFVYSAMFAAGYPLI